MGHFVSYYNAKIVPIMKGQSKPESPKILLYDDVLTASTGENGEPLVPVETYDQTILGRYIKADMIPLTGETIYVRDGVAKRLAAASFTVRPLKFTLHVAYGYRAPEIQQAYFNARKQVLHIENPSMNEPDLRRLTHGFVADPTVAGHPTGGAVDITLLDENQQPLEMETGIADYSDPSRIQTFDESIDEATMKNRLILHDAMVGAGFVPFYGEWWHFSYGDREWAAFTGKPKALYGPCSPTSITTNVVS